MIGGKTKVCGLIGDPVEHTLSPLIHNTLAKMLGQDLVYVPFPVKKGRLEEAVLGAAALQVAGLNVTVPYKSEVIPYLKGIDELAEKIGAVNTLVPSEGGFRGYNTDMEGLYRAMVSEGIRLEGEEVLVLGAGGAARAAVFLCVSRGASRVCVLNRSREKAQAVAAEVNRVFAGERVRGLPLENWRELPDRKYLVIQGTSVGLYPRCREAVIEDPSFYEKVHTGFDLIYRPEQTRFLQLVKEQGGRTAGGLKMLLYQGIIAYELWNGIKVPEETAAVVFEKLRRAL